MPETLTTHSLKALFRFPFEGENWQGRFLIGSALILGGYVIPIVPLIFVYGYALQVMRRAIRGDTPALPDWDDWGKFGSDGLRVMLVGMVYLLPGIVVLFGGMALYFGSAFFLPFVETAGRVHEPAVVLFPLIFLLGMVMMFLSMFVGSILLFLGAIPLPMAAAHFVARDKVGAAFRAREWWPLLRANALGYFIAWVVSTGLITVWYGAFMMAYYTIFLCCLIPLLSAPVFFYLSLVIAALFGQTYRESAALRRA